MPRSKARKLMPDEARRSSTVPVPDGKAMRRKMKAKTAARKAEHREKVERALRRHGVDTSKMTPVKMEARLRKLQLRNGQRSSRTGNSVQAIGWNTSEDAGSTRGTASRPSQKPSGTRKVETSGAHRQLGPPLKYEDEL